MKVHELKIEEWMIDKFLKKVNVLGPLDCWEWQGGIHKKYGIFSIPKIGRAAAHRFSYKSFFGDLSPGLVVMHTCDNCLCVNPAHLMEGTNSRNSKDMHYRGRAASKKGTLNGRARLSEQDVSTIKHLIMDNVPDSHIADRYCVSPHTVRSIRIGNTWTDVPPHIPEQYHVKQQGHRKNCRDRWLTDEQVREVRELLRHNYSIKEITKRLGISRHAVRKIKQGQSYTHVHV